MTDVGLDDHSSLSNHVSPTPDRRFGAAASLRLPCVAVAPAVPKLPKSRPRVVALVAGVSCLLVVAVGAVWPMTLKIQTNQGTVTWNCGTRVSAKHYSLAQAATLLHDTRPLTVGNYTYSASRVARIDKAPIDYDCAHDLGVGWIEGATFLVVAGVILLAIGLVRMRWRWLVVPLVIAAGLSFFGVPLLYPDVFRLYGAWGLPGYAGRPGFG